MFDPAAYATALIEWISLYWASREDVEKVTLWITGYVDSTVAAKLLSEAIGPDKIYGYIVDFGDTTHAEQVCEFCGITPVLTPPITIYRNFWVGREAPVNPFNNIHFRKRIFPELIYHYQAQAIKLYGLVCNFKDLSDIYLGWCSGWEYAVGDIYLFANLLKTEVTAIGEALNIPSELLSLPVDIFDHKTAEAHFGFTYEDVDQYIQSGIYSSLDIKKKIDSLHILGESDGSNYFPAFDPNADNTEES